PPPAGRTAARRNSPMISHTVHRRRMVLDSVLGHGVVFAPRPRDREPIKVTEPPGYRPLYRQVYDIVVRRVAEGDWRPGEALPSEQSLARELGVSQGTMRKVLDSLTAEKVLERRQGKGTFIAENTQERTLFRFFRMARPGGKRLKPERAGETVKIRVSRATER